jgi:hypothetical protein
MPSDTLSPVRGGEGWGEGINENLLAFLKAWPFQRADGSPPRSGPGERRRSFEVHPRHCTMRPFLGWQRNREAE